tara:strand:+ start:226 stop:519 length:294 start_codon:yes stop_codon:yes gene_type:complete
MKKRKSKFKPILITVFICLIWISFNESGLIKWINLKYEENILSNELSNIQLEKEKLIEHINKLENDISYIEFLAYSKYKMVKPGEKIFRVKNTKKID